MTGSIVTIDGHISKSDEPSRLHLAQSGQPIMALPFF
jgi:hypothetical protein